MSVFAEFHAPVTAHPLGKFLARYPDVAVDLDRVVPTGVPVYYVWLRGDQLDALVDDLRDDPTVASVSLVGDLPDRTHLRVEWTSVESPLFDLVEENGATMTDVHGAHDGWTFTLRFADQASVATFYESCRGLTMELRQVYEADGFSERDAYDVTPIQMETLLTAYERGYFDIPRGVTLAELAEQLGVSEQAVSERLRRGLTALLVSTLTGPDDESTGRDAD